MKKNVKKNKVRAQKSRKELRKEQRLLKKARKNEFFQRKKNPSKIFATQNDDSLDTKIKHQPKKTKEPKQGKQLITARDEVEKLKKDMNKQRTKQLIRANEDEDKEIKKLEKQLKLNKRKRKSIPKSFAADGLDYLLEVCEQDNLKQAMLIDQNLNESGSEFEEDFTLMTGAKKKDKRQEKENDKDNIENDARSDENEEQNSDLGSEDFSNSDENVSDSEESNSDHDTDTKNKEMQGLKRQITLDESNAKKKKLNRNKSLLQQFVEENIEFKNEQGKLREKTSALQTEKSMESKKNNTYKKKKKENTYSKHEESDNDEFEKDELHVQEDETMKGEQEYDDESTEEADKHDVEYWEDIYGRTRDKQGNVVQVEKSKYIPPHLRAKETNENSKKQEQLTRLKKQMKGLINRLAESNMSSISSQIEELYMSNSRNDMNESLMNLLLQSLVATAITPDRLIMEHAMLIAILHANVGTEIGAHVLQTLVKKFNEKLQTEQEIENKELDNIILILSHLYNFKVFNSILMYNVLDKLAENFGEKEVELILIILKNIGFSLRKDDPLALKDLILRLQQKAGEAVQFKNNARVKFMLEVLLAIKNNNMAKIPNYDPSHIEHLKKLMKGLLRKGNYVTELKISLEDLLKADERGRWWVVGSAWTGVLPGEIGKQDSKDPTEVKQQNISNQYSKQLLELAQKHHMNTDVRRNIFCILMTAEDYLDAFEKLLHLGLKNQQEREIIYVIMHCCLQEKQFNPYYCHLAQKFCDFDRKFQIIIQYALWDKFKELQNISPFQLTNLAKFLMHLIIEKGLPLSVLKVIHFAEVDKITVKFLRQLLLGLLLHKSEEEVQQAFQRVALSKNLHIFREGIRLFIHHFLIRNLETHSLENVELLKQRAKMADKTLGAADSKVKF